jgi:hypothetical protein
MRNVAYKIYDYVEYAMKRIFMRNVNFIKIIISLLFLLTLQLFASDVQSNLVIRPSAKNCESIIKDGNKDLLVQRGCCSHHGGVCGCKSSRVTCCDGSYSPSCTCKGGETIIDEDEGFKIKL